MADVTITPGSVLGIVGETGTAGATITAGQCVYQDTADGNKFKLSDANGASATKTIYGVALNGASSGQPLTVHKGGLLTVGGTVVAGTTYILSSTPGGICPSTDAVSGMTICHVGVATTTGIIKVVINNSGAAVA